MIFFGHNMFHFDMLCEPLCFVPMPELTSNGGTMAASLRHQWHDTIWSVWMHPMYFILFRFGAWLSVVPTPHCTLCKGIYFVWISVSFGFLFRLAICFICPAAFLFLAAGDKPHWENDPRKLGTAPDFIERDFDFRERELIKINDPISKEKNNISPINYSELNKLAEDFGKCFVSQKELSAEQAFWLQISNPISEQPVVQTTPVITEAPSKLPKELFNDFDNGFNLEHNKVKTVFNQMEVIVKQYSVDKKYFDIQNKERFLDNDRLLDHIIYQDIMNIVMHVDSVPVNVLPESNECLVNDNLEIERLEQENDHLFELLLSQDIVHICVNSLATCNNCHEMQQSFIYEYNENLVLKAELAKKEHMVEKNFFDEVVLRCSRLKNPSTNLELKLQHQKERFLNNRPLNNCNAPTILEFFHINEWQAKLDAKDVSIANLRKHIESLKGKNVVEKDVKPNNANVIAPGMFKLDLEPLSPKALRPLDNDLDSACKYAKRIQEVLFCVKATCPSLTKPSEKLLAVTPVNKNKKVRFAKLATSSRIKSSISASRSQPSGNTKKNRISQTTSSNMNNKVEDHPMSVKSGSNKKNRVIKPDCNANVMHSMLNVDSELICDTCNECMFDAIHDLCVLGFVNDVNMRSKSKSAKSSKKKNIWKPTDFGCSKHMTGNRSQLVNFVYKFLGTIRFGNDQIAKIMGYGDNQMGNVTISQVYYVEGLGHNLFFVGQFCDSDLEVAFRKHTCYTRDLEGVDLLKESMGSNFIHSVSGRYDVILSYLSLV
nr:integrase, catalytic region, zinc finger, CCHC-type, peptidase aspartic, catalytic [Tanacetum cinerariifolium]